MNAFASLWRCFRKKIIISRFNIPSAFVNSKSHRKEGRKTLRSKFSGRKRRKSGRQVLKIFFQSLAMVSMLHLSYASVWNSNEDENAMQLNLFSQRNLHNSRWKFNGQRFTSLYLSAVNYFIVKFCVHPMDLLDLLCTNDSNH